MMIVMKDNYDIKENMDCLVAGHHLYNVRV